MVCDVKFLLSLVTLSVGIISCVISHDRSTSIRCCDVVYLKVRGVRNDILHSPNFEVTSADLTTYLRKMTDLLQEPALQNYASARRAVVEINKVTVLNKSVNIFGSVQQITCVHAFDNFQHMSSQ